MVRGFHTAWPELGLREMPGINHRIEIGDRAADPGGRVWTRCRSGRRQGLRGSRPVSGAQTWPARAPRTLPTLDPECDVGPEFVSHAILKWVTEACIETALIDPGKPWQNGTNESFNGKFRDEYLSVEWFRTRREAKVIIEAWRQHYNAVRPHSSLGYLTPHEFKQHHPPIQDHPPRAIPQE